MRGIAVGAALALVWLASACTPAAEPEVRTAAEQFQNAVRGGDTATACGLLSDEARSKLESGASAACPSALAKLRLPADQVGQVSVWGDNAQVKVGSAALFLAEFAAGGWKVTGAGCTFRSEDLPYDCDVEG